MSGRDQGLLRELGPVSLAAGIFSMIVGAGIFTAPAQLARALGAWAPLAILGCAMAVGAVAVCCAEACSRIPTSGGIYGCVAEACGPLTGFVCAILLLVGDVLACGGVAAALGAAAATLAPPPWASVTRLASILGVLGAIVLVNLRGVRRGGQFVTAASLVKLAPLVVFVGFGLHAAQATNLRPGPVGSLAVGHAVLLSLFTFMGMEGALLVSGEVRQPNRTIPRALLLALGGVTVLYVLIQVLAQAVLGNALAGSATPLADAMGRVSPVLRAVLLAGAALSMLGWLGADLLASPRVLFAVARDGRLPAALGRLDPASHSPNVAILTYALTGAVLAISGSFAELAVLSALASTVLYGCICVAAWRLQQRGTALAGAPLNFRGVRVAAVIGVGSMLAMIALASPIEILGLAVLLAVGAALYLVQARGREARGSA